MYLQASEQNWKCRRLWSDGVEEQRLYVGGPELSGSGDPTSRCGPGVSAGHLSLINNSATGNYNYVRMPFLLVGIQWQLLHVLWYKGVLGVSRVPLRNRRW